MACRVAPRAALLPANCMCAFQAKALGAGARIEWDPESLTLLGSPAGYGRVIRLKTGALLACFGKGGRVHVSSSSGDGRTWSPPRLVAGFEHGIAANPELLKLAGGGILCMYSERPTDGEHPFAIMVMRSADGGRTWAEPSMSI